MSRIEGVIRSERGFYIGDICYVLSEEVYENVFAAEDYADGVYDVVRYRIGGEEYVTDGDTFDNIWSVDAELLPRSSFAVAETAGGDGDFKDGEGRVYLVDSGSIGLVPAELICDDTEGGHYFEGAGEASFSAGDGVFEITLPGGETVYINTQNGLAE